MVYDIFGNCGFSGFCLRILNILTVAGIILGLAAIGSDLALLFYLPWLVGDNVSGLAGAAYISSGLALAATDLPLKGVKKVVKILLEICRKLWYIYT